MDERSRKRCSTCCSSAPAIRRVRSWRKPFSTAPDRGDFARSRLGASPRVVCIPYAIDLLKRLHYDVSDARSKSWTEFTGPNAPKLDFAFTLCDDAAAETCPVWPGQPMTAHWGLPDPAAKIGTEAEMRFAFADAMRMLTNRINIFVSLPMKSLDALTLTKAVGCHRQERRTAASRSSRRTPNEREVRCSSPASPGRDAGDCISARGRRWIGDHGPASRGRQ